MIRQATQGRAAKPLEATSLVSNRPQHHIKGAGWTGLGHPGRLLSCFAHPHHLRQRHCGVTLSLAKNMCVCVIYC